MKRFYLSVLVLSLCLLPAISAQSLPGTRAALTCVDIVPLPGLSSAQVLLNWEYLDRAAIILENTETFPIEITGVECYFGNTQYAMMANLRFYHIVNEAALPDLFLAGEWTGDWFPYGANPDPLAPLLGYAAMDLAAYPDPYNSLVFNPGDKYVVEIENLSMTEIAPGMKIAGEDGFECPPLSWTAGTNLYMDSDNGYPPFNWYFKEDVAGQTFPETNFFIQVKYVESADFRVPAMSLWGLLGVVMAFSGLMIRRFRKK